jgi:hypothetical protein
VASHLDRSDHPSVAHVSGWAGSTAPGLLTWAYRHVQSGMANHAIRMATLEDLPAPTDIYNHYNVT